MKAKKIAVLACKVGRAPEVETLDNDLAALQRFVGGYIESINMGGHVVCICNEEGALRGLPVGYLVNGTRIHGDFFFVRTTPAGNFASLSNKQVVMLRMNSLLVTP